MTSRLSLARPAARPADPGRVLLSGPPGSGRTETALVVATVLADGAPVLLIDTDYPSSLDLADRFEFEVLAWSEPHDPRQVAETIIEAGGACGAVVIDTTSAQWRGAGGVRDVATSSSWDDARAAHRELLDATRSTAAHVVATCDTDVSYLTDDEGRVQRVGTVLHQDGDIESRYQVALTIDSTHTLTIVNSPGPSLPLGASWLPGDAASFAQAYAEWLASGEPQAPADVVEQLRRRIAALPDRAARDRVKTELRAQLTGPQRLDRLRAGQVAAAEALVAQFEPEPEPEPEPVEAAELEDVAAEPESDAA